MPSTTSEAAKTEQQVVVMCLTLSPVALSGQILGPPANLSTHRSERQKKNDAAVGGDGVGNGSQKKSKAGTMQLV